VYEQDGNHIYGVFLPIFSNPVPHSSTSSRTDPQPSELGTDSPVPNTKYWNWCTGTSSPVPVIRDQFRSSGTVLQHH
jgi:hypothetical protein